MGLNFYKDNKNILNACQKQVKTPTFGKHSSYLNGFTEST